MTHFPSFAAASLLLGGCSLSTMPPASVRVELRREARAALPGNERPGARAPAYNQMSCYLLRAAGASISNQVNTAIARGRKTECLDLDGQFNSGVTLTQAYGANTLSVPSGQIAIEFLGVKSPLADCSGKTLAEIWSAGDPEIYSLAKYEGAIAGGEKLSIPLSYVQNTTPDRVAACQTSTPFLGPTLIYVGASGMSGGASVSWVGNPGGTLPPIDGVGGTMTSIPVAFPVERWEVYGNHAQIDLLVPLVGSVGSFSLKVKGGAGLASSCSVRPSVTPEGFEIGYYSSYQSGWMHQSALIPGGRQINSSIAQLSYFTTGLSGNQYFYISARAVDQTAADCSYVRVDSVTVDITLYMGRGGDVFRIWPHLEIH